MSEEKVVLEPYVEDMFEEFVEVFLQDGYRVK